MSDWTPDLHKDGGVKYLAIVDALEAGIADGRFVAGERLPAQRELAEMFGVTIATMTRAIAEASRRGLVVARPGSGTYVRDQEMPAESGSGVVDFTINTLPTEIVGDLLDAAMDELCRRRIGAEIFDYASYRGRRDHLEGSAAWLSRFGVEARPDLLLATHGVHQGLMASAGALARPGDTVVCEPVTYTGIKRIAEYRGLRLVGADLDDQGLVPDSVERELRRTGAKILIATTVSQNPTTATLPDQRRRKLAEICRQAEVVIVEDGVNIPLADDGCPPIASYAPERTIHLTGLSKCVAPGFRIGYALVPEELLPRFHDALISTHWIAPSPLYTALASILLSGDLIDECLARHRTEARARMDMASRCLRGIRQAALPSYHAWIEAPGGWRVDDLCTQALRMGVRVSPASHFAIAGGTPPQAYRISLGGCGSRADLQAGLEILAQAEQIRPTTFGTVV